MTPIAIRREALASMTALLRRYVRGELETADFVPQFGRLFAPFDPPDLTSDDLNQAEQDLLYRYIKLKVRLFNEHAALIPKNPAWQYGRDTAPQSWIDTAAYRDWIRESLTGSGIPIDD